MVPASPRIEILLPMFDCERVLGEALDSLRAQTVQDWSALLLDDGSTDGTRDVAAAYAARDPRFRVVPLPHRGIPRTLNAGLTRCHAPLLARMDADDVCAPERLAVQLDALDALGRDGVVATRIRSFKSDGSPPGPGMKRYVRWVNGLLTPEDHRRERYVESPLAHDSVLLPRRLFEEHGPYRDVDYAEDYDLWLRLLQRGVPFLKPPPVLLGVRDDGDRISRNARMYSQDALRHCKQAHLTGANGPLAGPRPVVFWGAGRVGKPWLRELPGLGVPVQAVVDLHPRKLGKRIHGIPVIPPEALPERWAALESPLLLAGVGAPGARDDIRQRLAPLALTEQQDYLFVA